MMFEGFVAKRYLLSKKKIQFITIITLISVVGVSIGVAALISVLSVFNGFNKHVTTILTGFDPHLRIESAKDSKFSDYGTLIEKIKSESKVKGVSPFTNNKGIISSKKDNVVVFIKGVDEKTVGDVSGVVEKTDAGYFKFEDSEEYSGIVLGINLMGKLGTRLGDTLTLMSTVGMEKSLTQIVQPKTMRFIVRGIYDANNKDYDKLYAYISIPASQKLFELGNNVNGIDIRVDNITNSNTVKEKLSGIISSDYKINTWYDLHSDLYSVMQAERWTAYIILSIIIAVASFSIAGSLTMTVLEKKRDIGIMKAMGSSNGSIIKIFMYEGILIGVYGTLIGCALGLGICLAQIKFKLFPLDPMVYAPLDALPIDIRGMDFVYVGIAAMVLSFIASLFPAMKASKLEPIKAIRWE
ncbi:MAG: ABC transporter permease [Saprospiraceae bacterium]